MHRKLLLVEDDSDLRDAVRDLLEGAGYDVDVAGNGAMALEVLRSGCTPCLILLDLMMPVMDGYRFCEEHARDTSLPSVPIVLLSAVARLESSSLPSGVAGVLRKPVNSKSLLSVVGRYCTAAP